MKKTIILLLAALVLLPAGVFAQDYSIENQTFEAKVVESVA